jgi:hypothetical protein
VTHYFLLLDAAFFADRLAPALTACWRAKSFAPGRDLLAELAANVRDLAERFHLDEPLLTRAGELPFDRELWRHLVGESIFFGAVEIPEIETPADALCRLLSPDAPPTDEVPRERFTPIQQALFGGRDLAFGGYYRPDAAGWNDPGSVVRLAEYLDGIDPSRWHADALAGLLGLDDADDHDDELAYAREWFGPIRDLYRQAAADGRVIVCERLT